MLFLEFALPRPAASAGLNEGLAGLEGAVDPPAGTALPVLETDTQASPIPADMEAAIRLRHFKGTNPETLPATIVCGGRWDVLGAPMNRT